MKHLKPILIGIIGFVIFAVLFFGAIGVAIYKFNYEGRLAAGASKLIPYPAARINWHLVKYSDFLFDVNTLEHFYKGQENAAGMPAPDEKTLRENILERLIDNYFLEELAKENDVSILKNEIEERYKEISEENQGEENLKKMLKDFYDWSPDDFKRRVIFYTLLGEKLEEAYGNGQKLDEAMQDKTDEATIRKYIE